MEKKNTLPLIYILSMPLIFVVANFITHLHMEVLDSPLYISVILYPLVYLITGLIIRRTSYKTALSMALVTLITSTLAFVIQWVLFSIANIHIAIYAFLSFLICELIFIYTYDFLEKTKNDNYLTLFILVLAITLIDHILFGAIVEGDLFSSSLLVRAIYVLIMPAMLGKPIFGKKDVKVEKAKGKVKSKAKE